MRYIIKKKQNLRVRTNCQISLIKKNMIFPTKFTHGNKEKINTGTGTGAKMEKNRQHTKIQLETK